MKLINKILKLSFFTTLIFLSISCEKDTLQEEVTNQETTTGKPLPNIKVNELTFTKESKVIQTLRTSAQSKFKTYRTNGVVEHNIVELPVGEINLDHGVELIDEQNRKNITFEVKEHNNDPNVFYNFMVINENEFWLYKIEKTLVTQNNIPAGSTIVSRQPLNAELNPSDPCPNITVFPPFGYETPENILTGGAGGVSIGSINNPNNGTNDGGFFNSGNFLGGITGGGYLGSQGGSSGTSGSSSSGGNNSTTGNGNGFSLSDITDPIVNGVTSAWNWIKNWFKGGCNTCPRRTTGGDGNSVQTNDIVIDIQDDCGSSTIYIIVQDAYVDKIISFEQYITYLHNNDRIFLYNNQYIVDYLETLIQQHNTNQNLMNILPDLISKTRNGIITWEFAQELIEDMINFPIPEGEDNGDEFNYEDYSNIQTQTQNLPNRNAFYSNFPKNGTNGMLAPQVFQLVGGSILNSHINDPENYGNACAIRVSRALNYSGNPIPIFFNNAGQQKTQKGADNLNYILDAASLLSYMKKTFPNSSPIHLVNKTPTEIKAALNGKWGIYIMIPKNRAPFRASGHADFWSNTGCLSGCYFDKAKEVYFWELF